MLEPRVLREPTAEAVAAEGTTAGMAEATGSAVPAGAGVAEKKKVGNGRKGRKGKGSGKKPAPPDEGEAPGSSTVVPPKLKEMKNQEAAVGQKLVLRCETTSENPALRFKWLKNGKEITKKNKPENIKIQKKQKKYSELHIYRATLADSGEYVCRVSSKLGNDSTKASVIITDTNESTSKIPVSTEGTKTSSQPMLTIQASTEGTNTSSFLEASRPGTDSNHSILFVASNSTMQSISATSAKPSTIISINPLSVSSLLIPYIKTKSDSTLWLTGFVNNNLET